MKVLVVEDNKNLNSTIKKSLENEFIVFCALDGKRAKEIAFKKRPNVILLDIMLPDVMGYDLIDSFKSISQPIIIMISALEEEETRRLAYEKGADDYIIKPLTIFELKYKLKAIEKRTKIDNTIISIGDITLNTDNNELICQNNMIILQPSQIAVFKLLHKKYEEDEVLAKDELIDIEGMGQSMSFRIHTVISRLRKSIMKVGSQKIIIDNVYGKGYKMVVMK